MYEPNLTELEKVERKAKDGTVKVKYAPMTVNGTRLDSAYNAFKRVGTIAENEGDAQALTIASQRKTEIAAAYRKVAEATQGRLDPDVAARQTSIKVVKISDLVAKAS